MAPPAKCLSWSRVREVPGHGQRLTEPGARLRRTGDGPRAQAWSKDSAWAPPASVMQLMTSRGRASAGMFVRYSTVSLTCIGTRKRASSFGTIGVCHPGGRVCVLLLPGVWSTLRPNWRSAFGVCATLPLHDQATPGVCRERQTRQRPSAPELRCCNGKVEVLRVANCEGCDANQVAAIIE